MDGTFRRRKLPHYDVEGMPVFITACLDGSISAAGLSRIRGYRDALAQLACPKGLSEDEWEHRKHKLLFKFVDELLDHASPVRHLEDERQARVVQDAFLHFAGTRYVLLAFVVMPSHHHWLFVPDDAWSVTAVKAAKAKNQRPKTPREIISHSIQSYTGTVCNRIRGVTGNYWQHETFDHWARDEAEMFRIIQYIENNPVAAGLVDRPEDWKYSSAHLRASLGIAKGEPLYVG